MTSLRCGEPAERLNQDDQAARAAQLALEAALQTQRARTAAAAVPRGLCANCGEACGPAAIYCDPACRADHEARMAVLARQRKPPR